jgi:hypothetical protein
MPLQVGGHTDPADDDHPWGWSDQDLAGGSLQEPGLPIRFYRVDQGEADVAPDAGSQWIGKKALGEHLGFEY